MKYKHLAGIGFSIIFGLSFLFSKQALEFVSPIGLIAYRFLIAWLFFMLLAYVFKLVKIQFDKKMFKYLLLCGLFQPVIYFMTESYGLNLLGTGEAGLMIAIIPIFVTILSAIFLKELPRKSQIIFMLMSIIGVMVIQLSQLGHDNQLLGFVFMFIAVIAASLFNITSRYISKTVTPVTSTFFMTTMGALVFNTIYTIELLLNDSLSLYITNLNHIELIMPILYLGIVASVGGFFLVNTTLKHMPAHVSSIYTNISTVIAIVAGLIFLNEYLYIYHYIGAVLILVGVYGTVKFQSTKSHISN